ncbi:protein FAM32A-like [Benincasa hispida]|uniref:protein FAM32A-like n=1 Tax=Benincasa hispida TaxID=102211 RepID=UPI0018FF1BFF|nr:protein FAM32A-like [Benincasa hispida]XP_038897246.1 protein FAM32A-like [Benincasa hispida]
MSEYENVVMGKLRIKGKALGVKGDGIRKKKKPRKQFDNFSQLVRGDDLSSGKNIHDDAIDGDNGKGSYAANDNMLTPAERRYLQQWEKIDLQRMAQMASKSHRDRIQEFNQYLANLSEHHDIPKVGPG